MGVIADLANGKLKAFPGQPRGSALWAETFGTDKERAREQQARQNVQRVTPGGSWGASNTASANAFKRLLEAHRSRAPGGWTDDRYEQTKHQVGIQHICITRVGEQLLQSEYQVFHRDPKHPDGKRPVESDHPLIQLLGRPNNEDTFGDLMYCWWQQMNLTGSALTWMVPNALGTPMELYPVPTAMAIPQPVINPEFPNGFYRIQPLYPYGPFSSYPVPSSSIGAPIPAEWMMSFKFRHPLLRYDGYAPQTGMRLHLDEVESIDRSRWYAMKRAINPSAVMNFDETEGMQPLPEAEIERIHAEWENEFMGPENTGRLIVGAPGGKLEPWGNKPIEMDYQQGWSQLVDFIMPAFGITKGAAGMTEGVSSYAALFAMLKQLHVMTLTPFCVRVAAKLTRFLAAFYGDDLIVEVRCPRIDDQDLTLAKLNALQGAKSITKGEYRRELGMTMFGDKRDEELAGEGGEQAMMQQQQMMMGGGEGAPGTPATGNLGAAGGGPQVDEDGRPVPPDLSMFDEEGNPAEVNEEGEETKAGRPIPGNLGIGGLGPRKDLLSAMNGEHNGNGHSRLYTVDKKLVLGSKKSLYKLMRERCRN